tara:strand:- start:280 stop:1059 length:780 start_codon:yes stop_codon:yes gene_type:complete
MILKQEDSSHWYTVDGRPAYGKTLRDARKEVLLPSPSSINSMLSAPGLELWKQQQILEAALTMPEEERAKYGDDIEALANAIIEDSKAATKKAADRGTDVHHGAEAMLNNEYWDKEDPTLVKVNEWIQANVVSKRWTEEILINKELGYGGRADALLEHQEHGLVLVDFKTQKCRKLKKGFRPTYYDKWILQLAAYSECIDYKPRCLSVVINTVEPTDCYEKLWTDEEQKKGYEMFINLHALWCWTKNYYPAQELSTLAF